MLKAAGFDWHDLARHARGSASGDASTIPTSTISATGAPPLRPPVGGRFEIMAAELLPLVQAVRENVYCDDWTDEFLASMEARACRWAMVILSEKQTTVLVKLIERIPA